MPELAPSAHTGVRADYDAFLAACPSRQLLDRISNKWVVLVLCALSGDTTAGPRGAERVMRYSELLRQLSGVSQKMLTQTLRALERDGMVNRQATPTVPVTVTYELTDLGRSLHELAGSLRAWAEEHMDLVQHNRQSYDAPERSLD